MVGHDMVRDTMLLIMGAILAEQCHCALDNRHKQVGFVIILDSLQDSSDAFQSQASIDGGSRQWRHLSLGIPIILHEDKVPELQVVIVLGVDAFRSLGCNIRTLIIVNF